MSREQLVRWLLEKLLGSFVISGIIFWGPIMGINVTKYSLGTLYALITAISISINLIVYLLVPINLQIVSRIKKILKMDED